MTASGTHSFLVGVDELVVVDPGPADPEHLDLLLAAAGSRPIAGILLTHRHEDHGGNAAALAARSGTRMLTTSEAAGFGIEPIAAPGHTSDHMAYRVDDHLLTGDHVFETTSTLIDAPDGRLDDFLATTERLGALATRLTFHPAHGPRLSDPAGRLAWLAAHRRQRHEEIARALAAGPAGVPALARRVYGRLPDRLSRAAERNLLAHLLTLRAEGRARSDDDGLWRA